MHSNIKWGFVIEGRRSRCWVRTPHAVRCYIYVYILYEQQSVLCGAGKECRSYLSMSHDFYFFVLSIFSLYSKKMSDICSLCCCCCWSVKSARVLAHAQLLLLHALLHTNTTNTVIIIPSLQFTVRVLIFLHSRKVLTEHLWWYDLLHLVRVRVLSVKQPLTFSLLVFTEGIHILKVFYYMQLFKMACNTFSNSWIIASYFKLSYIWSCVVIIFFSLFSI